MAARAAGPFARPMAATKPPSPMIDQRLLRGRRERSHGRPARVQPAADQPGDERTAAAAERQRNGADRVG